MPSRGWPWGVGGVWGGGGWRRVSVALGMERREGGRAGVCSRAPSNSSVAAASMHRSGKGDATVADEQTGREHSRLSVRCSQWRRNRHWLGARGASRPSCLEAARADFSTGRARPVGREGAPWRHALCTRRLCGAALLSAAMYTVHGRCRRQADRSAFPRPTRASCVDVPRGKERGGTFFPRGGLALRRASRAVGRGASSS